MANYDLVITGGRVIDPETNLDATRNVGIKDGKIAAVTESAIEGKETIDASGHVVCPGFIDMHQHNTGIPFGEKMALLDGVTTPLDLEVGAVGAGDWYAGHEGKCRANYGTSSGVMGIREHILNPGYKTAFYGDFSYDSMGAPDQAHTTMKWSTDLLSPEQLKEFARLVEEGIEQGAIGIGFPVGYMVDGCTQAEALISQQLAGKYGHSVFLHGRFSSQMPPTSGILGFLEMMGPQEVYGGGICIHHLHAQALKDTVQSLELVDRAREKGAQVIAEVYPYNYGATMVAADYLQPDNYGPNMGRSYEDIIETATNQKLTKDRYDELLKANPLTSVMFYHAQESDLVKSLEHPNVVVGSDAFPYIDGESGKVAIDWDVPVERVKGHPRGGSTHTRVLQWVREKKINVSLPLAISKMTNMIATYLEANGVPQMADKGRLQEGKDADITIFNPDTVKENATMQQGGLSPTGIPHVLVNGTVVVRDSKPIDGVFPGKPVYGSGKK